MRGYRIEYRIVNYFLSENFARKERTRILMNSGHRLFFACRRGKSVLFAKLYLSLAIHIFCYVVQKRRRKKLFFFFLRKRENICKLFTFAVNAQRMQISLLALIFFHFAFQHFYCSVFVFHKIKTLFKNVSLYSAFISRLSFLCFLDSL